MTTWWAMTCGLGCKLPRLSTLSYRAAAKWYFSQTPSTGPVLLDGFCHGLDLLGQGLNRRAVKPTGCHVGHAFDVGAEKTRRKESEACQDTLAGFG